MSARRLLSNPWIATIGGMCYSIYLVHYPLFVLMSRPLAPVGHLPTDAGLVLAFVVLVPVALLVGAAFFVLMERPCMDPAWPERLARRLRATKRPAAIDHGPIGIPDLEQVSAAPD